MLHKVFTVQWHFPCQGDWTLQVKKDLEDFEMSGNLEDLCKISKESYKRLVKKRAKEFTFSYLLEKKGSYSKINNLQYSEFAPQAYLLDKNLSIDD